MVPTTRNLTAPPTHPKFPLQKLNDLMTNVHNEITYTDKNDIIILNQGPNLYPD